jgi:hypothetical protein
MRPGATVLRFAIVAAVMAALSVPAGAQTSGTGLGTVVVVHALEGFVGDVYLDGAEAAALEDFDFRRITDPLAVPAGDHRADIRKAGDPPTAEPAMSGTFTVTQDERVTVAALLDPNGGPSWLAFPNDTWTTDPASAAFRFRHVAAAGPVAITLDGEPFAATFTNLAVGPQAQPITTTPGAHTIAVANAATGLQLVAPQTVEIPAGTIVNVYLTGKASPNSLALLAQSGTAPSPSSELAALQQMPQQIATGDSGLAQPVLPPPRGWGALVTTAAAGLVGVAACVVAGRRLLRVRVR